MICGVLVLLVTSCIEPKERSISALMLDLGPPAPAELVLPTITLTLVLADAGAKLGLLVVAFVADD